MGQQLEALQQSIASQVDATWRGQLMKNPTSVITAGNITIEGLEGFKEPVQVLITSSEETTVHRRANFYSVGITEGGRRGLVNYFVDEESVIPVKVSLRDNQSSAIESAKSLKEMVKTAGNV